MTLLLEDTCTVHVNFYETVIFFIFGEASSALGIYRILLQKRHLWNNSLPLYGVATKNVYTDQNDR